MITTVTRFNDNNKNVLSSSPSLVSKDSRHSGLATKEEILLLSKIDEHEHEAANQVTVVA